MNDPDHELLARFQRTGNHPAFAELVRRHIGLVHATAVRVTNQPALAEEVSQIVFIKLARLGSPLKPGLTLTVWLHRTTRSAAIDLVRSETRRRERETLAATQAMTRPPVSWDEISPVLDDIIDGLSPEERHVILSRYFEGRTHAEIAQSLKLSEDALRMRVNRSLEKVRNLLSRRGITTTAAALAIALPAHAQVAPPAGLAASVTASALASLAPTSALLKIGIVTMTKKAATLTAAALLLVAAGTAVFVATGKSKDPAAQASASSSEASGGIPGTSSGDSSRLSSKDRQPSRRTSTEEENALVTKYGESRVNLARKVTASILHLLGDDGIRAVAKMTFSADDKETSLADLAGKLNLTEAQKKQAEESYRKVETTKEAESKALSDYLDKNSNTVAEVILAGDAFKRGKITEEEYNEIKGRIDPRIAHFSSDSDFTSVGDDLGSLISQQEFVDGLKASLDPEQLKLLAGLLDHPPETSHDAKDEEGSEMDLNFDEPKDLETLDTSVATVTKMIDGVKAFIDGMKTMQPKDAGSGKK